MNRFKHWLYHSSIVIAVMLVAGFIVMSSGIIPIKASSGHWPVTKWFLQYGKERSVSTHTLGVKPPDLNDPALILKGAGHYETACRSCHGSPGKPVPVIAQSMTPPAPHLVARIPHLGAEKLFYIVKHGLKFTGMPAWPAQSRDDEVWAMVAFLQQLPALNEIGYQQLVFGPREVVSSSEMKHTVEDGISASVLQSCVRCHGADGLGHGSDAFPVLAGQRKEYLRNSLKAYARGSRHSGIMQPVSAGLSAEEIEVLAAHYAKMIARRSTTEKAADDSAAAIARGREIAHQGIPSQRVPACIECHDVSGQQRKPDYPLLAGQPSPYLELQLQLFSANQRGGSEYAHLMQPIAARLTPGQRRDVAHYFAERR